MGGPGGGGVGGVHGLGCKGREWSGRGDGDLVTVAVDGMGVRSRGLELRIRPGDEVSCRFTFFFSLLCRRDRWAVISWKAQGLSVGLVVVSR